MSAKRRCECFQCLLPFLRKAETMSSQFRRRKLTLARESSYFMISPSPLTVHNCPLLVVIEL